MVVAIFTDREPENNTVAGWPEARDFARVCNLNAPMWIAVVDKERIVSVERSEGGGVRVRFEPGGAEIHHYEKVPPHVAVHQPVEGAA